MQSNKSENSALRCEVDSRGVATLALCRPQQHNAFDDDMIAAISAQLDQLAATDNIRLLVLASEGKSFSAGADANWMRRMASYDYQHNLHDAQALASMLEKLQNFPQPTIARVQGAAYGGGVGLVSCCDFAIGSERANFCLSEVKIGLIPATISPYVIAAIGPRAARQYFISADAFGAEKAVQLGLLSDCVASDELDNAVAALCSRLLKNGPVAMSEAKRLCLNYQHADISAALIEDSCERIAHLRVSPEGQEGLCAFLEKRQPQWATGEDNNV